MKNHWNKADISQLKNLIYRGYTIKEIYTLLNNRTPTSIDLKIKLLNLTSLQKQSEELRSKIIDLDQKGLNANQIATNLNVDIQTVTNKLYLIKLKQQNTVKMKSNFNKMWSKEELETLSSMVKNGSTKEQVAEKLGRTAYAITKKMNNLNKRTKSVNKNNPWTAQLDEKIEELSRKGKSLQQIADALGRTYQAVSVRKSFLNKKFVNKILEPAIKKPVKVQPYVYENLSNQDNMKIIQQILDSGKKAIIIL